MRYLIVLAGLAIVLCISPALSETTRITRTNGGANGYNYVVAGGTTTIEVTDGGIN